MDDALGILKKLRTSGHSAYLVGGCVRDHMLGLPISDYDIATSATPSEVSRLFPQAKLVGAHFGVALVNDVEVATYRSDFPYSDGRRPDDVKFEVDPKEDARRRDFTVNALFWDPETDEILDFVGGQQDLQARIIRAIGY